MESLIKKYTEQHKNTPKEWKIAVIEKADDGIYYGKTPRTP